MKKRIYSLSVVFVAVVLIVSLILVGCAKPAPAPAPPVPAPTPTPTPAPTPPPAKPAVISLYVGETGSSGYNRGVAIKTVVEEFSDVKVTLEQLVGAQFSEYMRKGEVDLAGYNAYDLANAYNGVAAFKELGPNRAMRNMFTTEPTLASYQVRADSGIKTIQDLSGKKIYVDMPARPLLLYQVTRHLEYYGILDDVELLKWSDMSEGVQGVIEGRGDGFFTAITGQLAQLKQGVGDVVVLDFPERAIIEYVNEPVGSWVFQWMETRPLEVETYGAPAGIHVTGWTLNYVIGETVADEAVYTMLKTLYEHYDELVAVHKHGGKIKKEVALAAAIMPYHPGAVKYYKEQGMWTSELEALQQEMLKAVGKTR